MKTSMVIKVFLFLPLVLFLDYILLVFVGCAGCIFGLGDKFYCGSYCIFGKLLLGLSLVFIIILLTPHLVELFKKIRNAPPQKKQKSMQSS